MKGCLPQIYRIDPVAVRVQPRAMATPRRVTHSGGKPVEQGLLRGLRAELIQPVGATVELGVGFGTGRRGRDFIYIARLRFGFEDGEVPIPLADSGEIRVPFFGGLWAWVFGDDEASQAAHLRLVPFVDGAALVCD